MPKDIKTKEAATKKVKTKKHRIRKLIRKVEKAEAAVRTINPPLPPDESISPENTAALQAERMGKRGASKVANRVVQTAKHPIRKTKQAQVLREKATAQWSEVSGGFKERRAVKETAKARRQKIKTKATQNPAKTVNKIRTAQSGGRAVQAGNTASAARMQAQATLHRTRQAAQKAGHAATVTARTAKQIVLAVKATIQAAVAAVSSGGAVLLCAAGVLLIILVPVVIVASTANSSYGVFMGNDLGNPPLSQVVEQLDQEFTAQIRTIQAENKDAYDEIIFSLWYNDQPEIYNWRDILCVYAILAGREGNESAFIENPNQINILRDVMNQMVIPVLEPITVTHTEQVPVVDENGNITMETVYTQIKKLYIEATYLKAEQMAAVYHFTAEEQETLADLKSETNKELFQQLLGSDRVFM